MKTYSAKSTVINAFGYVGVIVACLFDGFGEIMPFLEPLLYAVLLVFIAFIIITPWKYFPSCTTLSIDGKTVRKQFITITTRSIPYREAYAGACVMWGIFYYVFSTVSVKGLTNAEIARLVWRRKAILYPWVPHIKEDFPDLFERT